MLLVTMLCEIEEGGGNCMEDKVVRGEWRMVALTFSVGSTCLRQDKLHSGATTSLLHVEYFYTGL